VIITEDDTRDEDSQEIAQMFVDGAVKAGKTLDKDLFVELDREKAIRKAIGMAKAGDLVLILGKGHEKTILRGDKAVPFEDIKVAEKVLKEK
jgi:UDP-N-acetylmuramoyl-L-alanyl-D-glutamate--2,6-diaminopimelate ligase